MRPEDIQSIEGVYRFYQDDQLIGEYKNALTEAGRSIIVKSLLGIIPNFVNSIAVGIDSASNVLNSASTIITNNSLGFEVARTQSSGGTFRESNSTIGANDALVFFGEIVDPFQYEIREVAIYPSTNVASNISIEGTTMFNFDQVDLFSQYGTYTSASLTQSSSARIGSTALALPGGGDGTSNYIQKVTDDNSLAYVADYSSLDLFKLAMFKSTTATGSINLRFYTDSSNYYTITFSLPSTAEYSILTATKGSATITGTPTWADINYVDIWNTSANTVFVDAVKIDIGSYFSDTTFGMISRAVLPAPILKAASIPVTIEYTLLVSFSGGS